MLRKKALFLGILFTLLMIMANDTTRASPPNHQEFTITWLGTASFLIKHKEKSILIDPGMLFLPDLTREKASALYGIDLVLVTHDDFDHVNRLPSIPEIEVIPIISTESFKGRFPNLNVLTTDIYEKDGIRVRKIDILHGLRHKVDHTGFEIQIGGHTIYHLGDGLHSPSPTVEFKPRNGIKKGIRKNADLIFCTIGGLEASVENAVDMIHEYQPKMVVPMHWQFLFRNAGKAYKFQQKVNKLFPDIQCVVPSLLEPFTFSN